jgi:hypothetical protein
VKGQPKDQVKEGIFFSIRLTRHPAGALEQRELGIDPDQEILAVRPHASLKVECPRVR